MFWKGRRQSGNVQDMRGMGGKGLMLGGVGTIVVVIIGLLMDKNPLELLQTINEGGGPQTEQTMPPNSAADEEALPATIKFNRQGQLLITQDVEPIPTGQLLYVIDENKSRKKRFTGLRPGYEYYFYFYTVNFRGVSALSEKMMLKCW